MVKIFRDENIEIAGRKFPPEVVKEWSDIMILRDKEIGKGNFGKVYQGFLHLDDVSRYTV